MLPLLLNLAILIPNALVGYSLFFQVLGLESSLYSPGNSALLDMWLPNIFSPSLEHVFSSYELQKVFKNKTQLPNSITQQYFEFCLRWYLGGSRGVCPAGELGALRVLP